MLENKFTRSNCTINYETEHLEKGLSEHLRDGENDLAVINVGQELIHHSLGPDNGALLAATRTQASNFSREWQHFILTALWTAKTQRSEVRIAAAGEGLEAMAYSLRHGSVSVPVALVVNAEELFEMVLDNFF